MKQIQIDDDLYAFIASNTRHIGESASDILRRLLKATPTSEQNTPVAEALAPIKENCADEPVIEAVDSKEELPRPRAEGDILAQLNQAGITRLEAKVDRFLAILATLEQHQGDTFARVLDIKGRNRVYFARHKDALLQAGSSTNPKAIPDSGFWVVTNNNTAKKQSILSEVALTLGYDEQESAAIAALLTQ